ncbi:protein NRT1/ PTR FAMILY 5.10-like [Melia azedarach]|uniref:Protein NRT1/ PTR FAMILY 5.10-like n=1 Tax=Melia azedarach TaxID=155640 RepID=A0ACC1WTJ4_MELAZ|nr:protein NRT1/ PTR FAMILY 5.10-like [Melia azedarach]
MAIAPIVFLLGTKVYRFSIKRDKKNPFLRIVKVFVAAIRNRKATLPPAISPQERASRTLPHDIPEQFKNHRATIPAVALGEGSQQFKFLNKALLVVPSGSGEHAEVCSISDVEEAKAILRLAPIWTISLIYGIVLSQPATFYTKQGATMDRSVTPSFNIPPASLQSLLTLGIVVTVPIYDRIFVPIARSFTGKPAGITTLQRIGTGMFLSVIHMVVAALIEMKRRHTAEEHGLVDHPNVTIPMSVCWLMPQYLICGVSEAFSMVGFQEFFYEQVPS